MAQILSQTENQIESHASLANIQVHQDKIKLVRTPRGVGDLSARGLKVRKLPELAVTATLPPVMLINQTTNKIATSSQQRRFRKYQVIDILKPGQSQTREQLELISPAKVV